MFIISIVFWCLFVLLFLFFIPGVIMRGAPFVPTHPRAVAHMLGFSRPRAGERSVDIGSGDGRIVIAMASHGVEAHGYEINPILVLIARYKIWRAGLTGRAFIHWRNFWKEDFSGFDIVTIYGLKGVMSKLESKLDRELKSGSRIISNVFTFPHWKIEDEMDGILLYIKH